MSIVQELLTWPQAHGGPKGTARLKSVPEDFVVREWLGFAADGDGPHWLITVRKRDANTQWIARELARLASVHPRDVGYAGLKDRRAISEQAFSIPVTTTVTDWSTVRGEGFEVIAAVRHRRKLKIGALRANDFEIVLRDVSADPEVMEPTLDTISRRGVPNYFGPQRFGRDANNLHEAISWFQGGEAPEDRQRAFALSAARSALFNQCVRARVEAGTWDRLLPGDVANLNGSGSIFDVPALDATLESRCAELDIHPTAPLWGRGELRTQGDVRQREREIIEPYAFIAAGLERVGLDQERRATRMAVNNLQWSWSGRDLTLRFRLNRGCFATSVIRELVSTEVTDVPLDES